MSAVDSPIPLVGRDAHLGEAWRVVAGYPGCLVVVGAPGTGRSRLAAEIADRVVAQGAVLVDAESGAKDWSTRLSVGLRAAGLDLDTPSSRARSSFVALVGDVDAGSSAELETGARLAARTHSLVIGCATGVPSNRLGVVTVEPLDRDASAELVEYAAEGAALVVRDHILDVGSGRPGVLVPLAEAARGMQQLDAPLAVPASALAYAAPLVRHLDDGLWEYLVWIAVLARAAEADEIAALLGANAEDVADGLDEMVERGVLRELPPPGPPRFVVVDPLVSAIALERLRPAERRRRYRDALEFVRQRGDAAADCVVFALGAADTASVVGLSVQAADDALEAHDPKQALEHGDRALRWWQPRHGGPTRRAAHGHRGIALHRLSRWPEAIDELRPLIVEERAAGYVARAIQLTIACCDSYWKLADRAGAMALFREHAASVDLESEPDVLRHHAALLVMAAAHLMNAGSNAQASPLAVQGRDEALRAGDPETASRALMVLGIARVRGERDLGGLDDLRRAREEALAAQALRAAALSINNEVAVLIDLGRPAAALALIEEGQAIARALGSPEFVFILASNRGEALIHLGRLGDARRELHRAARGWRRLGREHVTPADPFAGWLILAEGRVDEAIETLERLWNDVNTGYPLFELVGPLSIAFALALVEAGEIERAQLALARAIAAWRTVEEKLAAIPLLAVAAAIDTPDPEVPPLDALRGIVAPDDPSALRAFALIGESSILRRAAEADADRLRAAAVLFDECELNWWAAMCRLWAGRAEPAGLHSVGDLREARSAFRAMGADGWRVRCEAVLRARGERLSTPGPRSRGGALTAREQEVLALVSVGLSTAEVAHRLVVTQKTVRRHLEGVFRKLGVTSRAAAVHAARARGLLGDEVGDTSA